MQLYSKELMDALNSVFQSKCPFVIYKETGRPILQTNYGGPHMKTIRWLAEQGVGKINNSGRWIISSITEQLRWAPLFSQCNHKNRPKFRKWYDALGQYAGNGDRPRKSSNRDLLMRVLHNQEILLARMNELLLKGMEEKPVREEEYRALNGPKSCL